MIVTHTTTKGTAVTTQTAADKARMTRNITSVYRAATEGQKADGLLWYATANAIAAELDSDIDRAAGVLAALSPQTDWDRNVSLARTLYAEGSLNGGGLGANLRRAEAVLASNWRDVFGKDALKIRAFAACIADPQDTDAVCVDRHAVDIADGTVSGKDAKSLTPKRYAEYADAYRRAARILGVSPATVQAVTWVVHRETKIRCSEHVRRTAGRAA